MAKEQQPQPVSKQNPYDNSLFWIQVTQRDNPFYEPKSPFPVDPKMNDFQFIGHIRDLYKAMGMELHTYTDQELSDWMGKMNQEFNENLARETLDKL